MLAKAGEADRHIRTKMVGSAASDTERPLNLSFIAETFVFRQEEGREDIKTMTIYLVSCSLVLPCVYFQGSYTD